MAWHRNKFSNFLRTQCEGAGFWHHFFKYSLEHFIPACSSRPCSSSSFTSSKLQSPIFLSHHFAVCPTKEIFQRSKTLPGVLVCHFRSWASLKNHCFPANYSLIPSASEVPTKSCWRDFLLSRDSMNKNCGLCSRAPQSTFTAFSKFRHHKEREKLQDNLPGVFFSKCHWHSCWWFRWWCSPHTGTAEHQGPGLQSPWSSFCWRNLYRTLRNRVASPSAAGDLENAAGKAKEINIENCSFQP